MKHDNFALAVRNRSFNAYLIKLYHNTWINFFFNFCHSDRADIVMTNYLLTESEVFAEKSQTETLPYWPSDSEVNTARLRFDIFP